jgi:hypothetical protein
MIFAGDLLDLEKEYQNSWSGRCRGRARTAYTIGAEGLELRSDFIRWLGRRAIKNKEAKMILVHRDIKPGTMVLVFEGNDEGKTVEHILAEAICKLAPQNGGMVSSWAIHFCAMRHPFSTTQRLREMKEKFRKWWLGDLDPMETFIPGCDDFAYRWIPSENMYVFSPHFISWLREEYLEKGPDHVPAD